MGPTRALQFDPEPVGPGAWFRLGLYAVPIVVDDQLRFQEPAGDLDDVDAPSFPGGRCDVP